MSLLEAAVDLARRAHAQQIRKAGNVPYFTHLEAVAEILRGGGYRDEVTLACAYLHDLLEDQPAYAEEFRQLMPQSVVGTVEVLTERKLDEAGNKREKRHRFRDYVAALGQEGAAVARALPVSCADKVHNIQSILDAEKSGDPLLMRLSTRPGEHRAQLSTLRPLYASTVTPALLAEFDRVAQELATLLDAWLPGRAAKIAADAHLGQYDKAGEAYIFHPIRVSQGTDNREERIVALLHDVVEDSGWTLEELEREGFGSHVVDCLDHLTRRHGEAYEAFIERVSRNRMATRVKLLDLADNLDPSRIGTPTEKDRARAHRYERAQKRLRAALDNRTLQVTLDEPSRQKLRALAAYSVVRADHITLAFRVDPNLPASSMCPGPWEVGQEVTLTATHLCQNERVQAARVAYEGVSLRPADGGTLHVTISRIPTAHSRDSNALLRQGGNEQPVQISLSGVVEWVE